MDIRSQPDTVTIPLDTEALLWLWDVSSDKLCLSRGAQTALGIPLHAPLRSMAEFLTHIPPSCLPSLLDLRESLLCKGASTHMECAYPFKDMIVKENIHVLSRSANGRARRILGSFVVTQGQNAHWKTTYGTEGNEIRVEAGSSLTTQERSLLLFAVNSTGDGLWDWDATTNQVYYSPRYLSMLGYTAEDFPGHLDVWMEKIHPDDRHKIVQPQADIVGSPSYGDTFECTYRMRRKDGSYAWILGRGHVTHRNAEGRATRLVGMHADITQVQGDRDKLEELVKNDALTGLRSRSFCDLEVQRLDKSAIRPICVLSVDITGLKLVNDTLGHAQGDKLLTTVALLLRKPLRATDCVARMGGDEFVALLPGCSPKRGKALAAELQDCVTAHNRQSGELPIFAAVGLACAEDASVSLTTLLRQADMHMLKAKKAHRASAIKTIKGWIEKQLGTAVCLTDCRIDPF